MKYKTHIKLCAWMTWYMFLVQCEEVRNNHLTPLLVVTMPYACWFLWQANYVEISCDVFLFNLGLRFEGLLWKRCILKCQIVFEGHWSLQSWTLVWMANNVIMFSAKWWIYIYYPFLFCSHTHNRGCMLWPEFKYPLQTLHSLMADEPWVLT